MKIYTTVREDGNVGPDIIAKNFNEAEKELERIQPDDFKGEEQNKNFFGGMIS